VKSVATVGVVGGAAAALALPVGASPAELSLPAPATTAVDARGEVQGASRSAARSAAPAPAVSAPADAAPVAPESVGVAGVKAVAKPKPKPKPEPTPEPASTSEQGSSSSSSRRVNVSAGNISSKCSGLGLNTNAARLCTAVQSQFGLSSIGGYRPNAGEHSTGQAVDFMVSGSTGDAIAAFVQANVGTYNVSYLIWEQRYWAPRTTTTTSTSPSTDLERSVRPADHVAPTGAARRHQAGRLVSSTSP
jgi:hypothetical protein